MSGSNMVKAFFLGGAICLIGQVISHICEIQGLSADELQQLDLPDPCAAEHTAHRDRHLSETLPNGEAPELWCLSPVLPILWLPRPLSTRRKDRSSASAARSSPSPVRVILYGIFTSWALGFLYWIWTLVK